MRIIQGMPACMLCGCRYAALERRLGEVDRARAILVHASSLADPRVNPQFWADWNEFEVRPSRSCESAYQHPSAPISPCQHLFAVKRGVSAY